MTQLLTPARPDTTLRVRTVDPIHDERWQAFVNQHPEALVYHHPRWLECLAYEYRRSPQGLLCENPEGDVLGILPLMDTSGIPLLRGTQLGARRLSSLPRTPVAGPLTLSADATRHLAEAAVEQLSEQPRGTRLVIKGMANDLNQIVPGLTSVPWREVYTLSLPEDPQRLRFGNSRNHGRIRWAVNKASKTGIVVRRAESVDDLRDWYQLYLDTMRWHTIPPRPFRFFEGMWRILQPTGMLRLLLAEHTRRSHQRLLAGSILLMHGQSVIYAFNGRRREELCHRPNDLIQWHATHDACAEGYQRYDFGEVSDHHAGLAKYKSKWGAEPVRLYRTYYPAPVKPIDSGCVGLGTSSRTARAAWRRMPLRVTQSLGERLFRYF